jgi:hypothetical protein
MAVSSSASRRFFEDKPWSVCCSKTSNQEAGGVFNDEELLGLCSSIFSVLVI